MQFGTKLTTNGTAERKWMSEFLIIKAVAAWLLISAGSAFAANVDVDMLNKRDDGAKMVYSLDIVDVSVGDTVTWLPTAKGHNVQFIAGPDSAELPRKSKLNKQFTHQFDVPGVYLYQCTPHKSMGMIGLVVVGDNTNNKDAIASTKVNGKSKKKLAKLLSELD